MCVVCMHFYVQNKFLIKSNCILKKEKTQKIEREWIKLGFTNTFEIVEMALN